MLPAANGFWVPIESNFAAKLPESFPTRQVLLDLAPTRPYRIAPLTALGRET